MDTKIGTSIQAETQSVMSPLTQSTRYVRGTRGRGRARGFSCGTFNPGRDRGRGRGRIGSPRLSTTYYTPDQWAKLSPAQRSSILNARGAKRNISAVKSDYSDYYQVVVDTYDQGYAMIWQQSQPLLMQRMPLIILVMSLVNVPDHILTINHIILVCFHPQPGLRYAELMML